MYIVMFHFVVKPGKEKAFKYAWSKVTQGIFLFKGSLGSRLHINEQGQYIAYAQWPDKTTYEKANGILMSDEYEDQRKSMHEALHLEETRIIQQMTVEVDYLQRRTFEV